MTDNTSKRNLGDPPQGDDSETESPDPIDDTLGDPPQGGGTREIPPGDEGDPPQGGGVTRGTHQPKGGGSRGIQGDPPQGGGD